jgi:hypothetical protein
VDRYTSMGISNHARDFLEVAQIVRREKPENPVKFKLMYFFVCQSIELSLKAYPRGSGYTDEQLRRMGHNLDKCVARAKAAGVDRYVSLSTDDVGVIAAVNLYYQSKDLQYGRTGFKSYGDLDVLIALAKRLWDGLRPYCEQRRKHHFGKPTAIT